jgi:hypothetical protein
MEQLWHLAEARDDGALRLLNRHVLLSGLRPQFGGKGTIGPEKQTHAKSGAAHRAQQPVVANPCIAWQTLMWLVPPP